MRQNNIKAPEIKELILNIMTARKFKVIRIDCRSCNALIELPDKSGRIIGWYRGVTRENLCRLLESDPLYLGEYLAPGKFNGKKSPYLN